MKTEEQPVPLFGTQATIAALQEELAETNRGLVALTLELEERVDERTAELRAAHEELKATNSSLMQMTLELEDRIAKRTVELVIANKELLFQNGEKEKRAAELIIANKELLFQNEEKEKRAEEMRRMVTVVRDSNDAITIQDFEGRITAWNCGAELMYGYDEAEALAMNIERLTAADKVVEQKDFVRRLLAGEAVTSLETQRVAKDGRVLDVWMTVTKLVDEAGKPIGIASTERDITGRKQAAAEIRTLNADLERRVQERTEALQEANRELESFSYSVSHDLRAPLRHVQGYVEMLTREAEGRLSDKARRYLGILSDASKEMGVLIDDLLAFSRMGRAEMRETSVSLDGLVQESIRSLEPATAGRNIVWKTPPLPTGLGDPAMLKQVFVNLLANAVKFTGPRAPAEIEIGCAGKEGDRVILFVRDNGVGFDMQYVHKLFGVFQRLHRTDEFEGTGIGLANVRRIIVRHGGRVWAESKLNEGATFYFTLKPASSEQPRIERTGHE
jgi:PAS domain S-box-containing protein